MIWLFKVNEVFWNDKPKVNGYYTFDTNDIHFDITKYDISLYLSLKNYYVLSESNDKEIYIFQYTSANGNPARILVPEKFQVYNTIREFYKNIQRDLKLSELLNT